MVNWFRSFEMVNWFRREIENKEPKMRKLITTEGIHHPKALYQKTKLWSWIRQIGVCI